MAYLSKRTGEEVDTLLDKLENVESPAEATPSGDSLHYIYERLGATWNPIDKNWSISGISGLSNSNLRVAYINYPKVPNLARSMAFVRLPEMVVPFPIPDSVSRLSVSFSESFDISFMVTNSLYIRIVDFNTSDRRHILVSLAKRAFASASALEQIVGILHPENDSDSIWNNTFYNCSALREVRIKSLNQNISFKDSPYLSKDSILYAIQNATPSRGIVITLHETSYSMAKGDSDIENALAQQNLVSLASA